MHNLSVKLASSFALAAATLSLTSMADKVNAATMVDLELGLIIDASGSISEEDFELQLDAYQSIFSDSNFYKSFIEPGEKKQIAVSAFLFADNVRQDIGWTLIDSQNASTNFGKAFENLTRDGLGGLTNTAGAISTAASSIVSNGFDANQQSLDISTDGIPTVSLNNLDPRDAAAQASQKALGSGVDAINAIGVGGVDEAFLRDFIIGGKNGNGSDAFVLTASDFDRFTAALETKIQREVVTPPDPTPTPPVTPNPNPNPNPNPTPPVTPNPNPTPTPPVDPPTGAVPEPSLMLGILAAGVMRQRLAKHLKRQKNK